MINKLDVNKFLPLAKRYVWWESPQWACEHPAVLIANVMNLGNWEDWQMLRNLVTDKTLKEFLLHDVPPGYFSYRSWDYWHIKFDIEPIPPLPKRNFKELYKISE